MHGVTAPKRLAVHGCPKCRRQVTFMTARRSFPRLACNSCDAPMVDIESPTFRAVA